MADAEIWLPKSGTKDICDVGVRYLNKYELHQIKFRTDKRKHKIGRNPIMAFAAAPLSKRYKGVTALHYWSTSYTKDARCWAEREYGGLPPLKIHLLGEWEGMVDSLDLSQYLQHVRPLIPDQFQPVPTKFSI